MRYFIISIKRKYKKINFLPLWEAWQFHTSEMKHDLKCKSLKILQWRPIKQTLYLSSKYYYWNFKQMTKLIVGIITSIPGYLTMKSPLTFSAQVFQRLLLLLSEDCDCIKKIVVVHQGFYIFTLNSKFLKLTRCNRAACWILCSSWGSTAYRIPCTWNRVCARTKRNKNYFKTSF